MFKQKKNQKKLVYVLLTAVIFFLFYIALNSVAYKNTSSENHKEETTSKLKTAQDDFSEGEYREPGNTLNENKGSAEIKDAEGQSNKNFTDSSIISESGVIKIYSPLQNELLKNGDIVYGTSTSDSISYRIIDDISGMIASGSLKVVNGKFSGEISFSTGSNSGRIDIFTTDTLGNEDNYLEIPIRFN